MLVALLVLVVWRSVSFIQEDWFALFPWWIVFVVTGVIPQLFLLIYPLATRRRQRPMVFRLPRLKRVLTEALIAAPIIGWHSVVFEPITKMASATSTSLIELVIAPLPKARAKPATVEA